MTSRENGKHNSAHAMALRVLVWLGLAGSLSLAACQSTGTGNGAARGPLLEKVGVVDVQAVFERSRTGKLALEKLVAELGEQRRLLTEEEAVLKEVAARLEQGRAAIPVDDLARQTEGYLERLEQYRLRVQRFNVDVARRHRALIAEYLPRIAAVAGPLADREGFSALLHQGRPETSLIVLYRAPEIDLTDRVIAALDRQPM